MNLSKHEEFLRLTANQPLTLACSALADLLWDDFVRDTRPSVTYLSDVHNIVQLSRFGKEIFERLYQGDDVNWLVSDEACETYFKKVCNGDTTAIPEGYLPENGILYAIMNDLSQAAAWPQLLIRSIGDQFNAGNNAINILNELAEIIEEAINNKAFDVTLLTKSGVNLEQLRQEFEEAKEKGDTETATQKLHEGTQLLQNINRAIEEAKEAIQCAADGIIDSTIKNHDSINEGLKNLYGTSKGVGYSLPDLEQKKDLAKKLSTNKELKQLAIKLGTLRRVWAERKRARPIKSQYECITGAIFSDDMQRAFPTEVALAGTPEGKALFALKYSQKTLLTKDFKANHKNLGKGPIILYVDVSGSMSGETETWSKAITFVIAEHAYKAKRDISIYLFDTRVEDALELSKQRKDNQKLIDFIGTWTLGGGTCFNAVINHALFAASIEENADVLMVTDGFSEVSDKVIQRLNDFKKEMGTEWNTICVKKEAPEICHKFSDQTFTVNFYNTEHTIDCIQKCIL